VLVPKDATAQPKPSKPSVSATPPNPTTGVPKKLLKTLGELETFALVASAEVKHAQAEAKKAEGTLDLVLSEFRLLRTKYDL
jgi:hypothetical protein